MLQLTSKSFAVELSERDVITDSSQPVLSKMPEHASGGTSYSHYMLDLQDVSLSDDIRKRIPAMLLLPCFLACLPILLSNVVCVKKKDH